MQRPCCVSFKYFTMQKKKIDVSKYISIISSIPFSFVFSGTDQTPSWGPGKEEQHHPNKRHRTEQQVGVLFYVNFRCCSAIVYLQGSCDPPGFSACSHRLRLNMVFYRLYGSRESVCIPVSVAGTFDLSTDASTVIRPVHSSILGEKYCFEVDTARHSWTSLVVRIEASHHQSGSV